MPASSRSLCWLQPKRQNRSPEQSPLPEDSHEVTEKLGQTGPDVTRWQLFLIGQCFHPGPADGNFTEETNKATIDFQKQNTLDPDDTTPNGPNFPAPPGLELLASNAARQKIFGNFAYITKPIPGNPENILITDNWQRDNIVAAIIPQLLCVSAAPHDGRIWFNKNAVSQMTTLWAAWEKAGLLDRVLTWGGSFVPRFVRGSTTQLSNHSFGTAFDINMAFNGLSVEPARIRQNGSVRELVSIAKSNGFYWGGHFQRRDRMHFEIAQLK